MLLGMSRWGLPLRSGRSKKSCVPPSSSAPEDEALAVRTHLRPRVVGRVFGQPPGGVVGKVFLVEFRVAIAIAHEEQVVTIGLKRRGCVPAAVRRHRMPMGSVRVHQDYLRSVAVLDHRRKLLSVRLHTGASHAAGHR